jgi:hypothetical protein
MTDKVLLVAAISLVFAPGNRAEADEAKPVDAVPATGDAARDALVKGSTAHQVATGADAATDAAA